MSFCEKITFHCGCRDLVFLLHSDAVFVIGNLHTRLRTRKDIGGHLVEHQYHHLDPGVAGDRGTRRLQKLHSVVNVGWISITLLGCNIVFSPFKKGGGGGGWSTVFSDMHAS